MMFGFLGTYWNGGNVRMEELIAMQTTLLLGHVDFQRLRPALSSLVPSPASPRWWVTLYNEWKQAFDTTTNAETQALLCDVLDCIRGHADDDWLQRNKAEMENREQRLRIQLRSSLTRLPATYDWTKFGNISSSPIEAILRRTPTAVRGPADVQAALLRPTVLDLLAQLGYDKKSANCWFQVDDRSTFQSMVGSDDYDPWLGNPRPAAASPDHSVRIGGTDTSITVRSLRDDAASFTRFGSFRVKYDDDVNAQPSFAESFPRPTTFAALTATMSQEAQRQARESIYAGQVGILFDADLGVASHPAKAWCIGVVPPDFRDRRGVDALDFLENTSGRIVPSRAYVAHMTQMWNAVLDVCVANGVRFPCLSAVGCDFRGADVNKIAYYCAWALAEAIAGLNTSEAGETSKAL